MKRIKLILSMLLVAMLQPTGVFAQEEGVITSTFKDWTVTTEETDAYIYGRLGTEENKDWMLYVQPSGLSIFFTTLGFGNDVPEESCLQIAGANGIAANFTPKFPSPITGPIYKIVLRISGNYQSINGFIDEDEIDPQKKQEQSIKGQNWSSELKDVTLTFDGSINYDKAIIGVLVYGNAPIYIHAITIYQKPDEIPTSGTSGNLTWKAEKMDKTISVWVNGKGYVEKPAYRLIFSGTGKMADYEDKYDEKQKSWYKDTPWRTFEPLNEVVLGEGIIRIGNNAFADAKYLPSVILPSTLTSIGIEAFSGTGLTSISFPEGLESIDIDAFYNCSSLTTVSLPASLTAIDATSFKCNNIQTLTVAEGNTKYDSRDNCNAVILTAENQLVFGTPATVIPASVTSIGERAFFNLNNLKSFIIPDNVTSIGNEAFINCFGLLSLTIGSGVTSIGKDAFLRCQYLADVICYADPAALTWENYDNSSYFMSSKATKIHVKKADLAAWQEKFANINATFVGDLDGGEAEVVGDANGDGEIDVADIDFVIEHIGEPIDDTNRASDVNGDGEINVADVDYIIERIK